MKVLDLLDSRSTTKVGYDCVCDREKMCKCVTGLIMCLKASEQDGLKAWQSCSFFLVPTWWETVIVAVLRVKWCHEKHIIPPVVSNPDHCAAFRQRKKHCREMGGSNFWRFCSSLTVLAAVSSLLAEWVTVICLDWTNFISFFTLQSEHR